MLVVKFVVEMWKNHKTPKNGWKRGLLQCFNLRTKKAAGLSGSPEMNLTFLISPPLKGLSEPIRSNYTILIQGLSLELF